MDKKTSVTQSIEMTMSALVMYWKRFFERSMKEYSIRTVTTGAVLYSSYLHEGLVQDEIGKLLNMDKAYVTRELNSLARLGYIVRAKDAADHRKNHIIVTPEGKIAAKAIDDCRQKWIKAEFADISQNEREVFLGILSKMVGNLKEKLFFEASE
ncbi:MarR family winged helix-turn-helix transcriptional regulator [Anaerovibrio sp. RM50]|uniref:MarR family winged helix-turn-helix transcriptional regulator n=1 Tax=Anaerovibrio sp. RM50 TaxID=1200557 RepID=UPI00048186D0|nr:MarR family transcriptional regulator [Anaerovibrio sp. RM50]